MPFSVGSSPAAHLAPRRVAPGSHRRIEIALRCLGCVALALPVAGCRGPRQIQTADYADAVRQVTYSVAVPTAAASVLFLPWYPTGRTASGRCICLLRVVAEPRYRIGPQKSRCGCVPGSPGGQPARPDARRDSVSRTVQTAAGRQEYLADSQPATALVWQVQTTAARLRKPTRMSLRAQLAAAELEVIEQVKRAYYELYYIQQSIQVAIQNRDLLLRVCPDCRKQVSDRTIKPTGLPAGSGRGAQCRQPVDSTAAAARQFAGPAVPTAPHLA